MGLDGDELLREQATAYVNAIAEQSGGLVRRAELEAFTFEGTRVPLIAPRQGIWKPAGLNAALSFLTTWTPPRGLAAATRFDPVRRYSKALVARRLHQPLFRSRVLLAYRQACALCRLRHPPLLDAAHIKEDAHGGAPVVTNGLAMCAIHHRAFDAHVLTVLPNYRIEIHPKVLVEHDGPTLQYALQSLHGESIDLPAHRIERPDRDLLEERYERFRAAV